MKCEHCGGTQFTDTLGFQKMCVCCGEKVDMPAPVLDLTEEDEDIDTEKLKEVQKNAIDPRVQTVFEAVRSGEKIVEATKKAGISYSTWKKKARQAWVQPSLFPEKNSTPDAYTYTGGAR